MKKISDRLFPSYQESKVMLVMFGILWIVTLGVMVAYNGSVGVALFLAWTLIGFIPALLLWNKSLTIEWTGDHIEDPKENSANLRRQFKSQTIGFIALVYAVATWAIFTLGPGS